MLFVETLAGFIFIIRAFLVENNPNLIALYNTMLIERSFAKKTLNAIQA
ncbi:hypothetical protein L3X37_06790 [Sabulilitoribacter arenilitoris]|uniref:Uncharacterized protein n=1 Tax=Wocania arenilitoris TaxID=2044858 RepID=A0AAE3JMU2_9FLAO|nr:hypothetical protein [Wocania arenilitoris]MCF7568071.1 hypothetical protein [Wocania arenilitoris]